MENLNERVNKPNYYLDIAQTVLKRSTCLRKKYGAIILEDNPDGALRYENEHIPAIKTLDTTGNVVYCGRSGSAVSSL